ncbi:hypothetical protein VCHE48_0428 [Vibrio cholerae HE48]|uniref:hypothetical protein n=1 Tax=Gammaproteobacteria TaxID=1236 RepID=UPI000218F6B3|nr:hypothetical protein [Vibrio cholerae]EGR09595.1 hypothetical protein VCHE48_0428 [Vibrio cholerae HE48]HBK7247197.1 hypothetical protein [Vibrio cholerae]
MSMSLLVARFSTTDERLNADYTEVSKKFHVNDFIDDFIDKEFLTTFKVYDEDSDYTYKEVNPEKLLEKLNATSSHELYRCEKIDESKRVEKLRDTAKQLVMLNQMYQLCAIYYSAASVSDCTTKLIVA